MKATLHFPAPKLTRQRALWKAVITESFRIIIAFITLATILAVATLWPEGVSGLGGTLGFALFWVVGAALTLCVLALSGNRH